jgi:hypothetical protein
MAKTPAREAPKEEKPPDERTPLERMTDLTRRIIRVPKSEVVPRKGKKRKRG